MNNHIYLLLFCHLSIVAVQAQEEVQKIEPISFSQVTITDNFWKPRIEKVAEVTIPVCIEQTEIKTPRIDNFLKVINKTGEKAEGRFYDDSDVFKALEAIAYSLKNKPNPIIEKKADEWIDIIAAAQLPDGYINTYYTLGGLEASGLEERWTDMSMHEDYNGGHLIEAGVAYYNATGKKKLLDVGIRFADHFASIFGPGKRHWVTGHEELELALVKLFRVTGETKYLQLADWLLLERGHGYGVGYTWADWKDTAYTQDVVPVKQATEITGHAVRAMYLYTGVADVAAQTNDIEYIDAMKTVWEDVVYRNMYITGGIGSSGDNEGFSEDYDLPNAEAYCETCASVGMVFWNQRMSLLTGDSKYMDVLEKSLYNGAADGLSLSGDRFFYGNVLESDGSDNRREWFGTACCPSNIARLISSLGDYIYAQSQDAIWVNLFVGSETNVNMTKTKVAIIQLTDYPWNGDVKILVDPVRKSEFEVRMRVPGWINGEAAPGDTYYFLNGGKSKMSLTVNGEGAKYEIQNGYAVISREWKKGDQIELKLPMTVNRVVANEKVKENLGRVALQRGPLMYCFEGVDNGDQALHIILGDDVEIEATKEEELLEGIVTLNMEAAVVSVSDDGKKVSTESRHLKAIPYYTWNNRGSSEMQVWVPRKVTKVRLTSR